MGRCLVRGSRLTHGRMSRGRTLKGILPTKGYPTHQGEIPTVDRLLHDRVRL